jgi:hypothetical protein
MAVYGLTLPDDVVGRRATATRAVSSGNLLAFFVANGSSDCSMARGAVRMATARSGLPRS